MKKIDQLPLLDRATPLASSWRLLASWILGSVLRGGSGGGSAEMTGPDWVVGDVLLAVAITAAAAPAMGTFISTLTGKTPLSLAALGANTFRAPDWATKPASDERLRKLACCCEDVGGTPVVKLSSSESKAGLLDRSDFSVSPDPGSSWPDYHQKVIVMS